MKLGQSLFGFEVIRVQPIPKDGAVFYELRHKISGARLAWMKNSEENKLFSIAFKTIPFDDTGVFHILEHTVLNGSHKYPVKEPFVELMKSSTQTFLNAMTFPDKTVFPVSSRNDVDFLNLTKVYLDAVFAPAIYENPCIFQQEGWHYALHAKEEDPVFQGVVFNEMKGAMSNVFAVLEREMNRLLFPKSCYRFVAGGDPASIPSLTYEAYLDCHRKFYNPSNAYIYLDGSVDVEPVLKLLDEEYLSAAAEAAPVPEIPVQATITSTETVRYYEISPEEPLEHRAFLSFGKVIAAWQEREKQFAVSVLCEALTGSNDAPLKRALLDTGLCWDVSMHLTDGIQQPYVTLCIQNTDYAHREALRATLRDTVRGFVSRGIDRAALSAAIDRLELQLREGFEPRGLERNLNVLSAWLYGGDPLLYIGYDTVFPFLREMLGTGFYENLLAEMLLDETGMAFLYLLPSQELGTEQQTAETERLRAAKAKWTEEQLQRVLDENTRLDIWQQSLDTPEQLAALPRLPLSEVRSEPQPITTQELLQDGVRVLYHPARDRGIAYLNLYFSLGDCTEEELSKLAVMTNLLGQLPTRKYMGAVLQQKIQSLFGSLTFSVDVFSENSEHCKPFFAVKISFLEQRLPDALALLAEILTGTDFTQPELIRQILLQCQDGFRQSIIEDGHRFAIRRALAHFSAENAVREQTAGFDAYERLKGLLDRYDEICGNWIRDWTELCSRIFCLRRLTVGMTSAHPLPLAVLSNALTTGRPCVETLPCRFEASLHEGIAIPSAVSYAAACISLPRETLDLPTMQTAATILSFDYLWNEVRVKCGAYGTGMQISSNGNLAFYSYRDPSPASSLVVFRQAAGFLQNFCESGESLDRYIISTLAQQEPLQTDCEKGELADALFFQGITQEKRWADRQRILSLKTEDLADACSLLAGITDSGVCVIGNGDALATCKKENLTCKTI